MSVTAQLEGQTPHSRGGPPHHSPHSSNSGTVPGTEDLRETRRTWASPKAVAVTTPDHPAPERPMKTPHLHRPTCPWHLGGANRPYPQAFSALL